MSGEPTDTTLDQAEALYLKGEMAEALALSEAHLSAGDTSARAHHVYGLCLLGSGQVEAALASLQRAVEMEPGAFGYRLNLGIAQVRAGLLGPAKQTFLALEAVNPRHPQTLANLARLAMHEKDFAAAAAYYQRAIDIAGYVPEFHSHLGVALMELGRFDEGRQSLREAVALTPGSVPFVANLERAVNMLPLSERLAFWEGLRAEVGAKPLVLLALARVLTALERPEEALRAVVVAASVEGPSAEPLEAAARLLAQLGENAKANAVWQRAQARRERAAATETR